MTILCEKMYLLASTKAMLHNKQQQKSQWHVIQRIYLAQMSEDHLGAFQGRLGLTQWLC